MGGEGGDGEFLGGGTGALGSRKRGLLLRQPGVGLWFILGIYVRA